MLFYFFQKLWQIHATPGSVVHCGVQGFQKWYPWPWLLSLLKNENVLSLRKQMCTSLTQSFFAEKVATVKDNCCFSLFLLLPCLAVYRPLNSDVPRDPAVNADKANFLLIEKRAFSVPFYETCPLFHSWSLIKMWSGLSCVNLMNDNQTNKRPAIRFKIGVYIPCEPRNIHI